MKNANYASHFDRLQERAALHRACYRECDYGAIPTIDVEYAVEIDMLPACDPETGARNVERFALSQNWE